MRIGIYSLTIKEISGGLADLGIMIPLLVALISINGLSSTTMLLGVGVIYIISSWYFRIPMPVQPLKSLAIVAIARGLSPSVIAAAALLIAFIFGILSMFRGIKILEKVIPNPVIRGIQIGLGIILVKSAYQMVFGKSFVFKNHISSITLGSLTIPIGVLIGLGSIILLLILLNRLRQWPAALVILLIGVGIGFYSLSTDLSWVIGPSQISFGLPKLADFPLAFSLLVVPQVPLTLANSIYATADAAKTYFGEQARKATPSRISWSIALGNLWAGLAGGLPNCHGSGGLTAHYRLGARTPLATSFLGICLIFTALVFGKSTSQLAGIIPAATLGAILFYVGVQHIFLGMNVKTDFQLLLAFIVGAVSMLFGGNLALGAACGLVIYWTSYWIFRSNHLEFDNLFGERAVITNFFSKLGQIFPSS